MEPFKTLNNKKIALWGAGPTYDILRKNWPELKSDLLIDKNAEYLKSKYSDITLKSPNEINESEKENYFFIITAHSAGAIRAIFDELANFGLVFGKDFVDISYIQAELLVKKLSPEFSEELRIEKFKQIHASILQGRIDLETTIIGCWILDAFLTSTSHNAGNIVAEVGAFRCGNAMLQNQRMLMRGDFRRYHIFDSFEGFGKMSEHDPADLINAYNPSSYDFNVTKNLVSLYKHVSLHKGYVPEILNRSNLTGTYDVVFYDCDLYQPAIDTFEFFWPKMQSGGYFVFHDYVTYDGGWSGVARAVHLISEQYHIKPLIVWESTMAILKK